ncbi:MAG: hypothetical protein GY954_16915 [Alteromonas sp.]|nr:hypothetical protein [Alteromonas sp.]
MSLPGNLLIETKGGMGGKPGGAGDRGPSHQGYDCGTLQDATVRSSPGKPGIRGDKEGNPGKSMGNKTNRITADGTYLK